MGARAGTGIGTVAEAVEDRCSPFKSTVATFPDLSSDVTEILDTAAAARRTLIGVCATWDAEEEEDGWLGNALTAAAAAFDVDVVVDVVVVEDALSIFEAVTGKVTATDCTVEEEDTDIFVAF